MVVMLLLLVPWVACMLGYTFLLVAQCHRTRTKVHLRAFRYQTLFAVRIVVMRPVGPSKHIKLNMLTPKALRPVPITLVIPVSLGQTAGS
jgi:hypothetical protein